MAKKSGGIVLLGLGLAAGVGYFALQGSSKTSTTTGSTKGAPPPWWPSTVPWTATAPPGWPAGMPWPPNPNSAPPPGFPTVPGYPSTPTPSPSNPSATPPLGWPPGIPFPAGFDPSQWIPGSTPQPTTSTCELDENIPPDVASKVNLVLVGTQMPAAQYDSLSQALLQAGFPKAAQCVLNRKIAQPSAV